MAWTREQVANAAIIVSVGRSMGLTTRDIQIGLITAMVESNLVNVNHGDRDSLGLFQQRPSQGWGTPEQVMDPQYASRKFFTTLAQLGDERYGMTMGQAAQAVQRSAYPDRYGQRIRDMRRLWPTIQGAAGETPQSIDGGPYSQYETIQMTGDQYYGSLQGSVEGTAPPIATGSPGGPQNGSLGGGDVTEVITQDPITPTAKQMLGAWGMDNPAVQQPESLEVEADPFYGSGPLVNPATNASFIQPLSEETGGFEPGVDGWRKAVISAAKSALGTPYAWGGNSLQGGVDCSGLIQQAFARAGISVPRVSYQQANFGKRVGLDALRPGDLVAWDNSSRNNGADHIALYLGNGQVIEAARPGTVVRIRTVDPDEGAWGVQINRS